MKKILPKNGKKWQSALVIFEMCGKLMAREKKGRSLNMDKYIDNKLAEEMDLIVLTTNGHLREGLPRGSVGTLIESYTGHEKPLYGDFAVSGRHFETTLTLYDFRVLNPKSARDIDLIASYLRGKKAI